MAILKRACRLLSVAESGYYEWRSRPPSQRAIRHAWLTYGARRVHAELTLGLGLAVGDGQVEMLMARAAIKGLPGTRLPYRDRNGGISFPICPTAERTLLAVADCSSWRAPPAWRQL